MRRCPACDKTFADGMKFCQTDGTLLIDDAPPSDPYKTVVGNQSDIASAIPPLDPFKTMVASPPPKIEEDILDLPEEIDSLKTMVVSQDEMKEALKSGEAGDVPKLDLPPPAPLGGAVPIIEPKVETPADFSSVPPKVNEPSPNPPNFEKLSAPETELPKPSENVPSKFDSKPSSNDFSTQSPYGNKENKPIPSPFDLSMPPGYQPPSISPFDTPKPPVKDPEPMFGGGQESSNQSAFQPPTPFGQAEPFNQPLQQTEWTPPPVPVSEWGNQDLGANTPFQPPVTGGGQSQTLAIVSLILGGIGLITIIPTILIVFCAVLPLGFGLGAIITGFLARSRAKKKPEEYAGSGLAVGGIITGVISFLVPLGLILLSLLFLSGAINPGAFR